MRARITSGYAALALVVGFGWDSLLVPSAGQQGGASDVIALSRVPLSYNPCEYEAERSGRVAVAGASRVIVEAGAGSLQVSGREGATEVSARGHACASSESLLRDVRLEVSRQGDALLVKAHYPRSGFMRGGNTLMDLEVEVPAGIAATIEDGSGSMRLSMLGGTRIEDGSGEIIVLDTRGDITISDGSGNIRLSGVRGSARIDDGSGGVEIEDVDGSIELSDGSGDVDVRRVGGSVSLEDGSGTLTVRQVRRDVIVRNDGSGSIHVSDVDGDFRVRSDGSGSIDYARVAGAVDVPED